jgi:hypothetical protein
LQKEVATVGLGDVLGETLINIIEDFLITAPEDNGKRAIAPSKSRFRRMTKEEQYKAKQRKESYPIALKMLRGRREGAELGRYQSGTAPYGYRRDYNTKEKGTPLVPDPKEASIVNLIFNEYLRLKSMNKVIDLLKARGIKTRRGKQWSRAGISWILKNTTYLGMVRFGEIRTKGLHEPIIAPSLYNSVQRLIKENTRKK